MSTAEITTGLEASGRPIGASRSSVAARILLQARSLFHLVLTTTPLAAADGLAMFAAIKIAGLLVQQMAFVPAQQIDLLFWPLLLSLYVTNLFFGLFPGVGLNPVVELRQTAAATTLLIAVFLLGNRIQVESQSWIELALLFSWPLAIVLVPLGRHLARSLASRYAGWGQKVLIIGDTPQALRIQNYLARHAGIGLRPLGILTDNSAGYELGAAYLGRPIAARRLARRHGVQWAIIVGSQRESDLVELVERFAGTIPHRILVPEVSSMPSLWNRPQECGGMPSIRTKERLLLPLPRVTKRIIDIAFTVVGGIMLLPLMAMTVLAIKWSAPGPAFYAQERIGLGGKRFRAWKFRTMVIDADAVLREHLAANPDARDEWERDHKLRNDPRVTTIGRILRKTSLDELPQLWNVLRGQMSLVGPRPIVNAEVAKYSGKFELYKKVLPGITGLWQVSGRNDTTYEERIELDTYYVRNWSPWLDIYLLFCTIKVVLLRQGAY